MIIKKKNSLKWLENINQNYFFMLQICRKEHVYKLVLREAGETE